MNKKPTFFISSTIYDFRDLRSALKFYLEELGYQVYASEYNDFKVASDKHSYDACLKLIEECDYFILLVGSRVGGFYDTDSKISITRQEYREAYKLHEQGKLQIISFVREDIWQLKETRTELARHLRKIKILDEEIKNKIINFETKFANDASLISEFINEIGKNNETKKSLQTKDALPVGNWIWQFKGFKDIIETLIPIVKLENLGDKFQKELLRSELLFYKSRNRKELEESPTTIYDSIILVHDVVKLPKSLNDIIKLPRNVWMKFCLNFVYYCHDTIDIDITIIYNILTSNVFYEYSAESKNLIQQPIYQGLIEIKKSINSYNIHNNNQDIAKLKNIIKSINEKHRNEYINIPASTLMSLLIVSGLRSDINLLASAILNGIETGNYISPPTYRVKEFLKNCWEFDYDASI